MQTSTLVLLLFIAVFAFTQAKIDLYLSQESLGYKKAFPLPSYYGTYSVLLTLVPVLLFISLWISLDQLVIERLVVEKIPKEYVPLNTSDYRPRLTKS